MPHFTQLSVAAREQCTLFTVCAVRIEWDKMCRKCPQHLSSRFTCSYRELHEMWHFMWNRLLAKSTWNLCRYVHKNPAHLHVLPYTFSSMYWPFQTKTPSQSEIFFCYCSLFCILAFQVAKHPPKVKYFFKAILLLVLSACVYVLTFEDQNTLPKWNIFCYCSFFCILAFQDQNTLPKWNIFCYCSFFCILTFIYQNTPTTGNGERNWIMLHISHIVLCLKCEEI